MSTTAAKGFRPAYTTDMSVLDVLVHKMGARAAKIRLDKLKGSENDAVMSVYPDIFWTPYHDESPQDKATREEEEKEETELEDDEEIMWSSFSVGGGCTKSWRWVISMSSPWRHPPLMRHNHNKLRIQNTCDLCDVICMRFYILMF